MCMSVEENQTLETGNDLTLFQKYISVCGLNFLWRVVILRVQQIFVAYGVWENQQQTTRRDKSLFYLNESKQIDLKKHKEKQIRTDKWNATIGVSGSDGTRSLNS